MGLRADSARPQRVRGSARTDSRRAESARNPTAANVKFGDGSALNALTRTQWTAALSHAQLARHEWLQLVVSSQWERDSYRGYISVARHRAVSPPGLKVRGHGGAECRTVMM